MKTISEKTRPVHKHVDSITVSDVLGRRLVRALLAEPMPDLGVLAAAGVSADDLFADGRRVFDWAVDYHRDHGTWPTGLMAMEATGVELPEEPEPLNYVVELVRKRSLTHGLERSIKESIRLIETREPDRALDVLRDSVTELEASTLRRRGELIAPAGKLLADHPTLPEPIIDGLLRRGETSNIIAPTKTGKSWLALGMALSVATGKRWLSQFDCRRGRVLLIDNELSAPVLSHRIQTVAEAMGIDAADVPLDVLALRGQLLDVQGIARKLDGIPSGTYDLVVLDALYRALPSGASENDNAGMAAVFNLIDRAASRLGCAWVNVHHSTKGNQSEKSVTDVGAGAGSQSRAADAHVILRQHQDDGCYVLEAVVRSFAPMEPLGLRWTFPLWQLADGIDTTALKGKSTSDAERRRELDALDSAKLLELLASGPKSERELRDAIRTNPARAKRLLLALVDVGQIVRREASGRGGKRTDYVLAEGATAGGEVSYGT